MAPRSILYVTVEGVLIPSAASLCRISEGESCLLKAGEHIERLEDLLANSTNFGIVLNSSLIVRFGFRAISQLFPSALRGPHPWRYCSRQQARPSMHVRATNGAAYLALCGRRTKAAGATGSVRARRSMCSGAASRPNSHRPKRSMGCNA